MHYGENPWVLNFVGRAWANGVQLERRAAELFLGTVKGIRLVIRG